jgi:hypothetical protein
MEPLKRLVQAVDDFQQRHRWLAFPFAVVKKYGDDQAGRHAALLAYYGFFSLFPLLLMAVTLIGFILQGRSDLADRIATSTAASSRSSAKISPRRSRAATCAAAAWPWWSGRPSPCGAPSGWPTPPSRR